MRDGIRVEFSALHPDGLSDAIGPVAPGDLKKLRAGLAQFRAELLDLETNPIHKRGPALLTSIAAKRLNIETWETAEQNLLESKRGRDQLANLEKGAAK